MVARILARPVFWIVALAIAFLLVGLTVRSCTQSRTSGAEAALSDETAKAVSDSGKDAIGSVDAVSGRNTASDNLTRENDHAIRNAQGAAAPVDPGVDGVGRDSLCKRAAYRCSVECVQRAAARGVANPGAGCAPARR